MLRKNLTVLFSALALMASAQLKDYNYRLQLKGIGAGDTVYLANYFGKQLYYNDTAYADKLGNFTFKKKREIKPGQFAVVSKGVIRFTLLINEPTFAMRSDTSNVVKNMVCEGSAENQLYYDYLRFLDQKHLELTPIMERYSKAEKEKEKQEILKERKPLDEQVLAYQKKIYNENKGRLVGQLMAMAIEIEVPEAPKKPDGTIDSAWSYYYYRDHYFDMVDLKFDALAQTPAFHDKLETFFAKVVLQNPDTITSVAIKLTNKMNQKGDLFKYTVYHVMETYNKSNVMGMDAVWVGMADNFYLNGKAFWTDTAKLAKIKERADVLRPLLMGKVVHPLSLADTTKQRWIKLSDMKREFVVLVFWSPDCGHCKKEMPVLAELYNNNKLKDFDVYSVSSDDDIKWKNFIVEHKLNFTNVAVPHEVRSDQSLLVKLISEGKTDLKSLNYHDTFDVYSTPKIYVLDQNRKIIAKQIGIEQLGEILDKLRASKDK